MQAPDTYEALLRRSKKMADLKRDGFLAHDTIQVLTLHRGRKASHKETNAFVLLSSEISGTVVVLKDKGKPVCRAGGRRQCLG